MVIRFKQNDSPVFAIAVDAQIHGAPYVKRGQ